MNDQQFFAIALTTLPVVITVVIGILVNNARLGDVIARVGDVHGRIGDLNPRFTETNARISETNARINELRSDMNERFDEMKNLWRSELHRVEQVLDVRLKHMEER
jgi:chromosome segregation ATPase